MRGYWPSSPGSARKTCSPMGQAAVELARLKPYATSSPENVRASETRKYHIIILP